jgi:hypothetical protein
MPSKCKYPSCGKYAVFGLIGEKPSSCLDHITDGMINLSYKECDIPDCKEKAYYGIPGEGPTKCITHKLNDMVNLSKKKCKFKGCYTTPSFNYEGMKKALYCDDHKLDKMINIKGINERCKSKKCSKWASCGYELRKPLYCKKHKLDGMKDVVSKRCEKDGCISLAGYNIKDSLAKYCFEHKEVNMVKIGARYCKYKNCLEYALYSKKGTTKPEFCKAHKQDDMVLSSIKYCQHNRCEEIAYYDVPGGRGTYCKNHKEDKMINIYKNQCMIDNCDSWAICGIIGNKATHCTKHSNKGMVKNPNRKCKICNKKALWGINLEPLHCDIHKQPIEINLVEKPCTSCGLEYILDNTGRCELCNPELFKKIRLVKQTLLMDYLDERGLHGNSTDKIIDSGVCGKERPDRVYDFEDKIVIVECDEYQHYDRLCECEATRMINISQSFGGIPVYFIRWNPDEYKTLAGKKQETIANRHKTLAQILENIKNNTLKLPHCLLSVLYMYYDSWQGIDKQQWQILIEYSDSV